MKSMVRTPVSLMSFLVSASIRCLLVMDSTPLVTASDLSKKTKFKHFNNLQSINCYIRIYLNASAQLRQYDKMKDVKRNVIKYRINKRFKTIHERKVIKQRKRQ